MRGAVDVRDLSVSVDGMSLLQPVSFTVGAGRCLVLRGENGSGKTTLLRVLAGLRRPSHGSAAVLGRPVDERDAAFRRSVAALVGVPPLARDLTVREHLRLVALTWGASAAEADQATDQILADLGLDRLGDRFVHQLSSGQSQLFALALTLIRPAEVLLVDEPEQRLDAGRLGRVEQALRARREAGVTLVVATHDSGLAAALADDTLTLGTAA